MRQGSGSQESTCTRVSAVRAHRRVWHYDVDTLEWDDCEPSDVIAELPDDPSEFWDRRDEKNLLIM